MQFMLVAIISLFIPSHAAISISSIQLPNDTLEPRIQHKLNIRSAKLLRRGGQCYSKPLSKPSRKTSDSLPSSSRCENTVAQDRTSASTSGQQTRTKITDPGSDSSKEKGTSKKPPHLSRLIPQRFNGIARQERATYRENHEKAETQVRKARACYSQLRKENCKLKIAYADQKKVGGEEHELQLSRMAVITHSAKLVEAKKDHVNALMQAKEASGPARRADRAKRNGIKFWTAQANLISLQAEQQLSEARMNEWLANAEREHLILSKGRDHPETRAMQDRHANTERNVVAKQAQAADANVEVMIANNRQGSDSDSSGSSSSEEGFRLRRFSW